MKRLSSLTGLNLNSIEAIGLDVAKEKIDICLFSSQQSLFYRIANNSQAICQFSTDLTKNGLLKTVPFVLESTWIYHLQCALQLTDDWWDVKEINPIITHQQIGYTIRWTKTDTTDSLLLAELWVTKWKKLHSFKRNRKIIELRKKVSLLAWVEKTMQAIKAQYDSYVKSARILWINTNDVDFVRKSLEDLNKCKKELEKSIIFESVDEGWTRRIEIIDSITWISPLIAKICYTTFASNDFESKKQMLAYVWLDPKLRQSWTKSWSYKMSKRWNAFTRKKLFQAAFCWIQHYKQYNYIYNREIEKWKHHFEAVLTVVKKMIYTIRSLIKKNEMFDPNYCAM